MGCGDIIYPRCHGDFGLDRCCTCKCIKITGSPFGPYVSNTYSIIEALEKMVLVLDVEDKIVLERDFFNKENKFGYLKKGTWKSKF